MVTYTLPVSRNIVTVAWAKRRLLDTIHPSAQEYYLITVFALLASLEQKPCDTVLSSTPPPGHAFPLPQPFGFILWPHPLPGNY